MYMIVKHAHMTFAIVSILGFMVRGVLAINQHAIMEKRWIRIVPHINDTLLLLAAIFLAWNLSANPLQQPWLMAKIIGLVVYIALGTLVIKRKGSLRQQWAAYGLAILVFIYIASVAVMKSPAVIF